MMNSAIPIERLEVFASGLDHPECVAFDRAGNLWAGGEAGQVYRIDPAGTVETIGCLGSFNAGLAFSPDDELFVCNPVQGIVHVQRDGRSERFGEVKLTCPNFPVFDIHGNLYVSDSGIWRQGGGAVYRFAPDGSATLLAGGLGYANGLALSDDNRSLLVVESDTERIYRLDLSDGARRSVVAEHVARFPDGIALDADGRLYVACYASDDVHRIDPSGERTLFAHDRWAIKLSRPTNLAFHGGWMYVANLGRQTVVRAPVDVVGQKLANQR